jgi:hypothetical protein
MEYQSVTNILGLFSIIGIIVYAVVAIRRAGGVDGITKMFISALNNVESAWVNLLAFFIPYAVSFIPASMTFRNAKLLLGFENWEAINAAAAIEFFGIVTMDTALRFYQYNKRYTSDANKAPVGWAIFSYVFYLVIIISVNVMMEIANAPTGTLHWFSGSVFWKVVSLTLLSTLGFPSAVTIGIRTQHKEVLSQKNVSKNNGGNAPSASKNQPQREAKIRHASDYKEKIVAMLDNEYKKNGRVLAPKEITASLKIDHNNNKGYVSQTTSAWAAAHGVNKNADGNHFTIPK